MRESINKYKTFENYHTNQLTKSLKLRVVDYGARQPAPVVADIHPG